MKTWPSGLERKVEAYASSFGRADALQYWVDSRDSDEWSDDSTKVSLGKALEKVSAGRYSHLLIASTEGVLRNAEELAQQVVYRDGFQEAVILTYNAASLRLCLESAAVLAEKFGVTPILRPLMSWPAGP